MEHNGIFTIPKKDRGGVSVFYLDENSDTKWLVDLFDGVDIVDAFVDSGEYNYTGDVISSLVVVAGRSEN